MTSRGLFGCRLRGLIFGFEGAVFILNPHFDGNERTCTHAVGNEINSKFKILKKKNLRW